MEEVKFKFDQLPLEERFRDEVYNADDLNAALRGERVPDALGLEVSHLCVIHGIRHHYGFAQELRGVRPEFTRALNARDIMSGIIPEMNQREDIPYCIWHPDILSEETLRALVQRYPDMRYHAARECAIAGYIDLYKELDVLPEVHLAEEASYASAERQIEGSKAIYQLIVSHHVKFAVFNDYNRTVDISNPRIAQINGDTAVYSSLAARQKHKKPYTHYLDGLWFENVKRTILLTTSISPRTGVSTTTIATHPHHQKTISRFCMSRFPSTFRQWRRINSFLLRRTSATSIGMCVCDDHK